MREKEKRKEKKECRKKKKWVHEWSNKKKRKRKKKVGNEKLGKVYAGRPKVLEGSNSDVLSEHIVTFSKRRYRGLYLFPFHRVSLITIATF